jgi:hypothetical protein
MEPSGPVQACNGIALKEQNTDDRKFLTLFFLLDKKKTQKWYVLI